VMAGRGEEQALVTGLLVAGLHELTPLAAET
jgi:hypothetical protein